MHFKSFKNSASNYRNVHEVPSYGYDPAGLKTIALMMWIVSFS